MAAASRTLRSPGIPLTWLIEKAGGASKDITGVLFDRQEFRTNGAQTHSNRGVPEASFEDVYLVYEIGGKPLDPSQGSPCINWVEKCDASRTSSSAWATS